MKFSVLSVLVLSSATVSALYYPPILSPAVGDVITAGSEFNVTWYVVRRFSDIDFTNFFLGTSLSQTGYY
jgi:hypothetical protein